MTLSEKVDFIVDRFDINRIYATGILTKQKQKNFDVNVIQRSIKTKPRPFVKWVGGKRQLLVQFRKNNLYPPEGFDPIKNTYYEPFVGGGATFFDLLPQKAVLSDTNFELITTYKVIKNDVESLIKKLKTKKYVYDKNVFLKIRSEKIGNLKDIEVAARFIYLNRTCFNGMYRVNSNGQFNVPFGRYDKPLICDESNLRKVSKALRKVTIKQQDYKKILTKAKKGDFIYFDPPYYPTSKTASFTAYTKNSFLENEQIELRDTFLELHKRGCLVMLSNSDTPFINRIYSEIKDEKIKINKVNAGRAINSKATGRGKIKETLVINY